MDSTCVMLGAGQHAKVVIDAMLAAGMVRPCALIDSNPQLRGRLVFGVPVVGGDDQFEQLIRQGVTRFVMGLGSAGNAAVRRRVFELGRSWGLEPLTVRHPTAICSATAQILPGSQILAGAVVNTDAYLGENVLVNTGAIVEHDCVIGAHTHISTGAKLAGGVHVGEGSHVGAGAVIRQAIKIGARAVVGAGAAVVDDVDCDVVVAGVPARPLRSAA